MTQEFNQTNDSGVQQSAEAQQSTAEQLKQKAEEVLAAVTPQAASAAAAAQDRLGKEFARLQQSALLGKVQAGAAGLTKMAPASLRKPWVGALALCAALVFIATLVFSGGNSPEGAATAYVTAICKGEVDKALALVTNISEDEKKSLIGILRQGKKLADDKGGLVRIEVLSSEIDRANPDRARVKTRAHYKNGQQYTAETWLARVKGKWLLDNHP